MDARAEAPDSHTFFHPGEELDPDTSSYLLSGAGRVVLVDPGPEEHVARIVDELKSWIEPDDWLFVVVQSPLPGSLSGLPRLATLTRRRVVVTHWLVAGTGADLLKNWNVRHVTAKGAVIPLGAKRRLLLASPPGASPSGSLISVDTDTATLYSGPYFGAVGAGRPTGLPIVRRECVRAYTDLYTPLVDPQMVPLTFGTDLELNRIAPAHGKAAIGGRDLIATLFEEREERPTIAWAFHRLFLRLSALAGFDAARGIYQASGIPIPDLERGYRGAIPEGLSDDAWSGLYGRMEGWLSSSILAAMHVIVVRLSLRAGLPIPPALERLGDAISRLGRGATGVGRAVQSDASTRQEQTTSDAPPELVPITSEFDDLTDPVTGLLDETVFRERLRSSVEATADGTAPDGAILFVGLDNIQRINASYGRAGGDEALHAAAYLLRNFQSSYSRRGAHRLYKLRGPLFAYVLETGGLNDAAGIAEQIRQEVAESAMFLEQLTVSIGVIAMEEQPDAQSDPSESMDEMLVRIGIGRLSVARQSGMNTVCSADPAGAAVVSSGSSVLIADPDAPYLEMLTAILREDGITVLAAADGAEALTIVQQIVPAVIVSEVMLPKVNGFALREELRHSSTLSEIPFVLVSQRKSDEVVEKASLLGIVHFLRKPFSLVELRGLIRNLSRRGSL